MQHRTRRIVAVLAGLATLVMIAVIGVVVAGGGHHHDGGGRSVPSRTAPGAAPTAVAPGDSTTARASHRHKVGASATVAAGDRAAAWTMIATTKGTIPSYAQPGGASERTISAEYYGAVSSLPVIAQRPNWLEVRLATRPDGSTAWVKRSDVTLSATPYQITIDLTSRRLTLYRLGRRIMSAPAGIGTQSDPTPTGHYFVAFFEKSPSAGYGPFILVTSAHSKTISDWEGSGDAVIGIHGPLGASAEIGTTGAYISHGCVRLQLSNLAKLRSVPAGSPISIVD